MVGHVFDLDDKYTKYSEVLTFYICGSSTKRVLFSKENVVNGLLGKMISFQKMCAI
jgi:hypothetical protein